MLGIDSRPSGYGFPAGTVSKDHGPVWRRDARCHYELTPRRDLLVLGVDVCYLTGICCDLSWTFG
jgi:hypothetical protein